MTAVITDPARVFVGAPNGSLDFGCVSAEAAGALGVQPGPVRLQVGYPGDSGFGRLHVEGYADRMKQITGLGFSGIIDFAYLVAQNYTKIGEGKESRLLLIHRHFGHDLRLVVQSHTDEGGYWTIVSGLPYRVVRCKVLYEVTRTGTSEPAPDAAERPRFATLSLPKKITSGDSGS